MYFYMYRPHAKIWDGQGGHLLEIDGVAEMLPVRRLY